MKPLHQVLVNDLEPGKTYLLERVNSYSSSPGDCLRRCKATFVENILPQCEYHCTLSKFTNIIRIGNKPHDLEELRLQDLYWKYYEADATIRTYTAHILQKITGDPYFIYDYRNS